MQGLFQRQVNRSTCLNSTNKLEVDYEDASAELAFSLFVENIDVITKPTQRSRRSKKSWGNSPPATTPLANFFSSEEFQTQLRCGHPFKLTESGKYGFIHESFKEFFIAKYLLADLEDAGDDTGGYALESAQDTWNAKLLPNKPVILSFLREAIEAQTTEAQLALKTQLWRWVTLKTAEYSNCSANSATLLVQLGVSFSKKDLSGTYLLGAMLSGGMFDSANFSAADCRGVDFSQAWLRRANFTHADLSNTEWGEYPKLELKGRVQAMYSDATGSIQIATFDGNNIYLWRSATGKRLATLGGHRDDIRCLGYNADGGQLASGSYDRTIRLWNVAKRCQEATPVGHTEWVSCLSYSADGVQLASGSQDRTIRLWNVARRCHEATLVGHTKGVSCLSYSADDFQLASGSDDSTIRLWNVTRRCLEVTLEGHTSSVNCLSYSADGVQLASGSDDHTIRLWNVARQCHEATLEGHTSTVECLSYSTDGVQLASGSQDRTIRLWNVARRCHEATLVGHTGGVCCLSYSTDGLQLASGSFDNTIRLWNLARRCQEAKLVGHTNWVSCLSYSADGVQLISGSSDHTIRLWNLARRCQEDTLEGHTNSVLCLSYSVDGGQLASGSNEHTIRLWNLARRCQEDTLMGHTGGVHCLSYSADGGQLASGSLDSTIRLWNLARRCQEDTLEGHTSYVHCLSYSADGLQLASGSSDHTIRLWNLARRCQEATLEGHTGVVSCLSYSADGGQLASGSNDHTIRLWNLARRCQEATLEGHTLWVRCLSYSADGGQLASGSDDSTIRLWGLARQCQEATLEGHTNAINCLSYSANGGQLASGSYDSTLRIWDTVKYVCLRILSSHLPIFALTWHEEFLAVGCNKEIVLFQTPQSSKPEAWYAMWRVALNPILCCTELKFSGARCNDITRRLLCQYGGLDHDNNSVASATPADSALPENFSPNTLLKTAAVELANSKNETDIKPQKHKRPKAVKNTLSTMDDDNIANTMPGTSFSLPPPTKGGGNCALHAALGQLSSGQYICNDVEQKRRALSKAVRTCVEHSELHRLVCTSIEALAMEGREVPGARLQALRELFHQFSNDNKRIQADAWQQFYSTLQHDEKVLVHVDNFVNHYIKDNSVRLTQQNISRLRTSRKDAFSTCLQEENNRALEVLIHSIPSLRDAYQTYRSAMSVGFNWEFHIDRAVIQNYANFIGTPGVWLLPSELHIIATVFEVRIDYYLTASSAVPDVFNPTGDSSVAVQFNGEDHYERRAEEANFPNTPSKPTQAPLQAPLLPTSGDTTCTTAPMATPKNTLSQENAKRYNITQIFTVKTSEGEPIGPTIGLRNKVIHHSFRTFLEERLLPYCQQKSDFFKEVTQRLQTTQLRLFLSYAWAIPGHTNYAIQRAHEVYVQKIAKDLTCAGFHIYLDRKEDRVGKILTKFIEKMELADSSTPTSGPMSRRDRQSDYILPICTPLYLWKYEHRDELFNTPDKVVRFEVTILNHIVRYNEQQQERIIPLLLSGRENESVPFLLRTQISACFAQQDYYVNFFKLVKSLYRLFPEDNGFKKLEREFYASRRELAAMDLTEIEQEHDSDRQCRQSNLQNHAELTARQAINTYLTKKKYKQHDLLTNHGVTTNATSPASSSGAQGTEEQQPTAQNSNRQP
jgi:WD40 repeat protein